MLDFRKLPLEAQLTAMLDGETTPEQKADLERRLAEDPAARTLLERLRRGAEFGRARLDDMLREPVPLALVRSIKSVQPPKASVAPRLPRPALKLQPSGPQALAAGIILLVLGCGIGYLAASAPEGSSASPLSATAPLTGAQALAGDVVAFHRFTLRQPRHLVEVPASQPEEISSWLTSSVGVAFRVPDMSVDGWTFQGARVILAEGRPTGQLVYTDAEGDVFAVYFRKDAPQSDGEDFKETIRDEIGAVGWHNGGTGYLLVGPSAEASLTQLAMRVATAI